MKNTLLAMMAMAVALVAATVNAETVEIASAADWAAFANRVNNGETTLDAVMTADVTLTQDSPFVGTEANKYSGTFDGAGHTLELNWVLSGVENAAPFAFVAGCNIHDLRTAGTISSDQVGVSGLIGAVRPGGASISRCCSSVQITSRKTGDATAAGFVGTTYWASQTIQITDCLFNGSLLGADATDCGGFVGFNFDSSTLKIDNSLFAPQTVTVSGDGSATFSRCSTSGGANVQLQNCRYTQTLGTAQGTDASSMSAEELVAALGGNWFVENGKAMLKTFSGLRWLLDKRIYTIASNTTLACSDGYSAITVEDGASAIINIKSGVTLTVTGADASGAAGAIPAIRVPESSTLYIVVGGKLFATGGAAANGGNGSDGGNPARDDDGGYGIGGGTGGEGGGGGAAAIGGGGGAGGRGGAGAEGCGYKLFNAGSDFNENGKDGSAGSSGLNGVGMGRVVVLGDVTVEAGAGAAATSDGDGGKAGGSYWHSYYFVYNGGGGGGGARGQNAEYGIGGGGAGGAGGGGGGGGGMSYYDRPGCGQGGNGGYSYTGSQGATGRSGGSQAAQNGGVGAGGSGGAGGAANTTYGSNGKLQSLDCVTLTVSPSRETEEPAALLSGENALADSVTVTFMSEGVEIGTATASLMFAPPTAPAAPEKAGYGFIGYFTEGGTLIYDAKLNPVYPVWQTVDDATLYARWGEKVASVTFVYEDTTLDAGDLLRIGGVLVPPVAPDTIPDGLLLLGYFTEAEGGEIVYNRKRQYALSEDSEWQPSGDITLYAHCCPKTPVELLTNGGYITDTGLLSWNQDAGRWGHLIGSSRGEFGNMWVCVTGGGSGRLSQTITLAELGIEADPGIYVTASVAAFSDDKQCPTCNVKVHQLDASGNVISTHTLMDRPYQSFDATRFSIDFTLNPAASSLKYEINCDWVSEQCNQGFQYCSMTVNGYTLRFVSLGATVGKRIYIVDGTDRPTPTAPILVQDGCRFLGWAQSYDENGNPVGKWTPTSHIEFHARLDPVSLAFKSYRGADLGTFEYQLSNNTVTPPVAPDASIDYHVFHGYFTAAEGGEQVYDENRSYVFGGSDAQKITTDTTLYAQLKPIKITFKSQGDTVDERAFTLSGDTVTPPVAPVLSRDGYRFKGYYDGTTQIYDENFRFVGTTSVLTGDVSVEAVWKDYARLSFVSEGVTLGTLVYEEGGTAPTAPVATRSGDYKFLGYFTDDNTQVYDENGRAVQEALTALMHSETKLTAQWRRPPGSVAQLVYRGQLTKLGTDDVPASDGSYEKTMHFRVYDDEAAETPVWRLDNQTVKVNKDGSFMATFGDDLLAELIATGSVSHVAVALGNSGIELKPRRALRPVAAVNRALVAEGAGKDPRIGNLVTENALAANNVTVSMLEVEGAVTAPGAGPVDVSPVVVGERETLTLLRGGGVNVFSKNRIDLGSTGNVQRGQKIGTRAAPSDGFALITSSKSGSRGLRIPGVIQYCREGEWVRAPASEPDGVKVTFFPFVGK